MTLGVKQKLKTNSFSSYDNIEYNDMTQGITWHKSDWERIQGEFAKIRMFIKLRDAKRRDELINSLDEKIERYQQDQTTDIEPISITEKIDKVTNAGRTRAAELITKYSSKGFDYMAIGTSQSPPLDGDWKLGNEVGRESSRKTGIVSPSGAVVKHICSFPPGFPSGDYWEIAPVDSATFSEEQMIFARVVFKPNRPLSHTQDQDFMTIHHVTTTTSSG